MRIKEGYMLRKAAGAGVIVAVGKAAEEFRGMIRVNDSGAFLFERLKTGAEKDELIAALAKEYGLDENEACASVERFISQLEQNELLDS